MKKTKIVTHNGKAHRDEYLACCVIMYDAYRKGQLTYIERRMCGESDLMCRDTWVVDTGGEWDPDFLNFDHHQDDPELGSVCSFDLVMRHIMGKTAFEAFSACSPWVKLTALHDTAGGAAAASAFGIDTKTYVATRSPIEKAMLSAFGEVAVIHPETPLAYCMRETGRLVVTEAEEISIGMADRISAAAPPFMVAGLRVWDVRSAWGDNDHVSLAAVNHAASQRSVDVVVGCNQRSGGASLYRTAWATAKMDLSCIRDMTGVKFVHKNGFYAVISGEVGDDGLREMLRRAAVGVSGVKVVSD
jgi:hypothetical protein